MKEAMGGTWLFGIVLTFVVLFTTFISLSTNYSRCFKIKDEIITTIEHYNGVNEKSISRINEYLSGIGYSSTGNCPEDDSSCWYGFKVGNNTRTMGRKDVNYCISKYTITRPYKAENGKVTEINGPIGHPRSAYYKVTVFFKLNWPIISSIFNLNISGETSVIYNWIDIEPIKSDMCTG